MSQTNEKYEKKVKETGSASIMPNSFIQKKDNDYRRQIKNADLGNEFKQLIKIHGALHALSKTRLALFCSSYSLTNHL